MGEKRKREWIQIIEPDGTEKIASPSWLKKHLDLEGIDTTLFNSMWRRIGQLEEKVDLLMIPVIEQRIVDVLTEDKGMRTQQWISRRVSGFECGLVWDLVKKGVLEERMSGHHKLYGILRTGK